MRKIVLDEISKADVEKVRSYLNGHAMLSEVEDLYWVELGEEELDEKQRRHEACKPYRFAVEVCDESVHAEFLIRSATTMRCDCIGYATPRQRDVILRFCDTLIERSGIRT